MQVPQLLLAGEWYASRVRLRHGGRSSPRTGAYPPSNRDGCPPRTGHTSGPTSAILNESDSTVGK
eukprot:15329595-Heterocapsa_arctica.AAC.1